MVSDTVVITVGGVLTVIVTTIGTIMVSKINKVEVLVNSKSDLQEKKIDGLLTTNTALLETNKQLNDFIEALKPGVRLEVKEEVKGD